MKQPIKLRPEMGEQVLQRLAAFAELPQSGNGPGAMADLGIVAGQAVASAVSEIFGNKTAVVYNDVDVFRKIQQSEKKGTKGRILDTKTAYSVDLDLEYGAMSVKKNYHYQVARTRREGLLNEVLCFGNDSEFLTGERELRKFVASFDLNCVQVGVDLTSRQLVWTPAFERFMRTQQLFVEAIHTPVHTAIRWFRKKLELEGVYGNDDYTMQLLAAAMVKVAEDGRSQGRPAKLRGQLSFSAPYLAKFKEVETLMAPWVTLKAQEHCEIDLYTLEPRFTPPEYLTSEQHPIELLTTVARAHQGYWQKHICEQIKRVAQAPNTVEHQHLVALGTDEFQDTLSTRKLAQLNNVFDQHKIAGYCVRYSLSRTMEFTQMLAALAATHGAVVYGLLEQGAPDNWQQYAATPMSEVKAWLNGYFVEKIEAMRSAPTVAKIAPEVSLPSGFRLKELTGALELADEGVRMHHCVQGYFESVARGSCRILSLRKHKAAESLTLEARKGWVSYTVVQARGVTNSAPDEVGQKAVIEAGIALTLANVLRHLPSAVRAKAIDVVLAQPVAMNVMQRLMAYDLRLGHKLRGFPGRETLRLRALWRVDAFVCASGPRDYGGWRYGGRGYRPSMTTAAETFDLSRAKASVILKEWAAIVWLRAKGQWPIRAPEGTSNRPYGNNLKLASAMDDFSDSIPF